MQIKIKSLRLLFIQFVKTRPDLKAQIKAALNQDQVIEIAAANGFDIDSSSLF